MLYERFLMLKRQTSSVTHNPLLDSFELSELQKLDELAAEDEFVSLKQQAIMSFTAGIGIDFHEKLKTAFDEYSEAVVYLLLKEKFDDVERIPETTSKTPDFRVRFHTEINGEESDSTIYLELKSLSFAAGNLNYKEVMEDGLKAKIDIEQQLKRGNKIGFGVSEIAPLKQHKKDYDGESIRQGIETVIDKIEQNLKEGQFALGNTILLVNLKQLSLPGNYDELSVPVFIEPQYRHSIMSGLLWNVAFGKAGHLIYKPLEFEGKPNIDGELNRNGVLIDRKWVKAICFLVYSLSDKQPKIVGLYCYKNLTNDVESFLYKFCDFVNDDANTMGYRVVAVKASKEDSE